MSDQNKQIARQFLAAFAAGDVAALEQLLASDVVDHNAPPAAKPGRPGLLDAVAMFRTGFPDMTIAVDHTQGRTVHGTALLQLSI
jgi:ketosteroid isomerase-like protein